MAMMDRLRRVCDPSRMLVTVLALTLCAPVIPGAPGNPGDLTSTRVGGGPVTATVNISLTLMSGKLIDVENVMIGEGVVRVTVAAVTTGIPESKIIIHEYLAFVEGPNPRVDVAYLDERFVTVSGTALAMFDWPHDPRKLNRLLASRGAVLYPEKA